MMNVSTCGFVLVAVFVAILGIAYLRLTSTGPVPKFDSQQYWGPGKAPANLDTSIRPFKIDVPEKDIQDLNYRLEHVRPMVPPLEGIQQQYGMNTNLLKQVLDFWRTKYNWKKRQEYLNKYPQFITNIQGLDLHYLHIKPNNPETKKVLPLIMLHGWPGSVREFYEIIPILTTPTNDRDFVFELIVPHIPGYGFSQAASKPGFGANQIAVVFNNLMARLGFKKYYCQGGDFGSIILQTLSVLYPESVLGFHTNFALINTPLSFVKYVLGNLWPTWVVRPDHHDRVYPLTDKFIYRLAETGYLHEQATKPDTIGVAVTDSPAGLAAYILEKFTTGTNRNWRLREDGGLLEKYTYTDLLDNVMIYWITGCSTTAFRLYAETFNRKHMSLRVLNHPLQPPTAIARFKFDFYVADGIIGEVFPNLVQLSDFDGGHFAAFERPSALAQDVFAAVEKFEKYNVKNNKIQK